jgi:hypothetical protein
LNRYWNLLNIFLVRRLTARLIKIARRHRAEAVLTVAHGHLWLPAAAAAKRLSLPLHLVVHDDILATHHVPKWTEGAVHRQFGKVYRQAGTRFCVSPAMVRRYAKEFGVNGTVLYPCRGDDSPAPLNRVNRRPAVASYTLVYAGALWLGGYVKLLRLMASRLKALAGSLQIYVPPGTSLDPSSYGFETDNVTVHEFLPTPSELADRAAQTATALFLPASFDPAERAAIEVLFPSKLADYTAMGLPILIWGPRYSSAVQWALSHPGTAAICEEERGEALTVLLKRLRDDAEFRASLADGAVTAGLQDFSLDQALRIFHSGLMGTEIRELSHGGK